VAELTYSETLVVTSCWCGIKLAIPSELESYARRHKNKSVYCPLGHTFIYQNTIEEQLARERKRLAATRDLLDAEQRSHAATRGHLTRARKRAKEGVCPCCNRTFANVARHVANKHPDFKPESLPA
jgi:hypothetical protein